MTALAVLALALCGGDIYVRSCGNDAWSGTGFSCQEPDGPKRTLAGALAAVGAGGRILLGTGSFGLVGGTVDVPVLYGGPGTLTFEGSAFSGGGRVTCNGGSVELIDCDVTGASNIFISNSAQGLSVSGSVFHDGSVSSIVIGGFSGSHVIDIVDSQFLRNAVTTGVVSILGSSNSIDLDVRSCDFAFNTISSTAARSGGALFFSPGFDSDVRASVVDCRFIGNVADSVGGGIGVDVGGTQATLDLAIHNCQFLLNSAGYGGGFGLLDLSAWIPGVTGSEGRVELLGCLFQGNVGVSQGSAIYVETPEAPLETSIVNATISDNSMAISASVAVKLRGLAYLRNSIVWGNAPAQLSASGAPFFEQVVNCCVEGGRGGSNISCDPLLVAGGGVGPGSPCIGRGDAAWLPPDRYDLDVDGDTSEAAPLDFSGAPRTQGNGIDMGALESVHTSSPELPCEMPCDDIISTTCLLFDPPQLVWSGSVGRLVGPTGFGTAFLVASHGGLSAVLTTAHSVPPGSAASYDVEFFYDCADCAGCSDSGTMSLAVSGEIARGGGVGLGDWVLLRLDEDLSWLGVVPIVIGGRSSVAAGDSLFAIHHPLGKPKAYSVGAPRPAANGLWRADMTTCRASSGAPCFRFGDFCAEAMVLGGAGDLCNAAPLDCSRTTFELPLSEVYAASSSALQAALGVDYVTCSRRLQETSGPVPR